MSIRIVCCLSLILALADSVRAGTDEDIAALIEGKPEAFAAFQTALVDGDVAAARKVTLDTFPEKTRRPIEDLMIGEMLFRIDEPDTVSFLARAAEKLATPEAYRELAYAQHRAGDCKSALVNWEKYLAKVPHLSLYALVAECRVQRGDAAGAVAAWDKANHPKNHIEIEKAISEMHGKTNVDRRRSEIWKRVRAGELAAAAELIGLDAQWEFDWWNEALNEPRLQSDLARLKPLLKDKPLWAELETFARLVRSSDIAAALRKEKWLLGLKSRLPSTPLARRLLAKIELPKEAVAVLQAHEAELRRRIKDSDLDALDVLAALYVAAKRPDELGAIDKEGWERLHNARFAASYLLEHAPKTVGDPLLKRAIAEFPLDATLRGLWMELAGDAVTTADLLPVISAEFHEPMGLMAPHDSYRLKQYFAMLAERVAAKQKK